MKKLFLFILCMAYAGLPIAAEKKENHLVERYSPVLVGFMNHLSSSRSLQDFVQRHRLKSQSENKNTSEYDELFKSTQQEIGIPDKDILSVRAISRNDAEDKKGYAFTSHNEIAVISDNFDQLPYGAKKIMALHESFHHKYHDSLFEAWIVNKVVQLAIVNIGLSTVGLWKFVSTRAIGYKLKIAAFVGAPIISSFFNVIAHAQLLRSIGWGKTPSKYDFFKEFRADRDAVEKAHCYKCVEEYSTIAGPSQYLTKEDLRGYSEQFKKEDACCNKHMC